MIATVILVGIIYTYCVCTCDNTFCIKHARKSYYTCSIYIHYVCDGHTMIYCSRLLYFNFTITIASNVHTHTHTHTHTQLILTTFLLSVSVPIGTLEQMITAQMKTHGIYIPM